MSRSSNSLRTSDVITTPIKLKYTSSYDCSTLENYGMTVLSGVNGPVTITGSIPQETLNYWSARHLYYSNYLTGSFAVSASSADNFLQSTAASGTFDADVRYFPTESGARITILSIPKNVFGERLSRRGFIMSSSAYYLIDDGNGNVIDQAASDVHVGNVIYPQGMVIITNSDYLDIISCPTSTTTSTTTTTTTAAPTTTTSTTTTTTTPAPTTTTTTTTTSTTTTTTTVGFETFYLGYDGSTGPNACSQAIIDPNPFYSSLGSVLQNGTTLYADTALTTPVSNGYYSDGTNYWLATGGVLSGETSCATTTTTTTTTSTTTTTTTPPPTTTTTTTTSTTTTTTTNLFDTLAGSFDITNGGGSISDISVVLSGYGTGGTVVIGNTQTFNTAGQIYSPNSAVFSITAVGGTDIVTVNSDSLACTNASVVVTGSGTTTVLITITPNNYDFSTDTLSGTITVTTS